MYINKSLSLTEWVTLYLSLSLVICWIKQLILSGGTSKIPKIQKAAAKVFDSAEVLSSVGPDEVTAYGAAIQAGAVTEKHSNPAGTSVAVKVMKSAISFIILDEENSEASTTYCANMQHHRVVHLIEDYLLLIWSYELCNVHATQKKEWLRVVLVWCIQCHVVDLTLEHQRSAVEFITTSLSFVGLSCAWYTP